MHRNATRAAFAASAVLCAGSAFGHITLEGKQAPADSYYKAVLRVGHGCEGSPTTTIRVQIPEGVTAVKVQPKQGWQVSIVKGPVATPVADSHGAPITERVAEVSWQGGSLLDEHYDEFVLRVKLPNKPGETIYFPTVQQCEQGVHRWIEIPAAGKNDDDYKEPAPQVVLTPKA